MENFRRQARNRVQTLALTQVSPSMGSSDRLKIMENLPLVEQKIIEEDTNREKNAQNYYMMFVLEPVRAKSHQIAIETDTAPRCYVKKISPVRRGSLALPYLPIEEFIPNYPDYTVSIVSPLRFIEYNGVDRKNYKLGPSSKDVSHLDTFESYIQALHGTLDKFWEDPTFMHSSNIWRLARTIKNYFNHLMKKEKNVIKIAEDNYENVIKAISNRDLSLEFAVEYKKAISEIPVASYYYILYQAMIMDPSALHKSNFVQNDLLLGGLFLMNLLPEEYAVSLNGIEDAYLRILFERSIHVFTRRNFSQFVDKDELIKFLHEQSGSRFHGYLRYNAFFVEVYRRIFNFQTCYKGNDAFSSSFFSKRQMCRMLLEIRSNVKKMEGINILSHFISPTSSSYLTDDNIAEFIFTSCLSVKEYRKFAVLSTTMFTSPSFCTHNISRCIETNLKMILKDKKEIEEAQQRLTDEIRRDTDNNQEISFHFLKRFLSNMIGHRGNTKVSKKFKSDLLALIMSDHEYVPNAIENLLHDTQLETCQILGVKKIMRAAQYARKENGNVHHWLKKIGKDVKLQYPPFKSISSQAIHMSSSYITKSIEKIKIETHDLEHAEEIVKFTKFDSAIQTHHLNMQIYLESVAKIQIDECPICFEEKEMVPLHGEIRHTVCQSCLDSLVRRSCPLCRASLK